MQRERIQWPVPGLLRELEAIEQVFATGSRPVRLSALCWMASVLAFLPPGNEQDAAEDRLSALIAEAGLDHAALHSVLAFRRQGVAAASPPANPTLRRGGPAG